MQALLFVKSSDFATIVRVVLSSRCRSSILDGNRAPLVGVREQFKKACLVEILPRHRAEPMPVSLVYPHRRHLARRVQSFIDWVEEQMRDYAE